MARAPFQVLVLPFRKLSSNIYEYALFRRSDAGYWQGIAGGGEDEESSLEAAHREAFEEAGIPLCAPLFRLQTIAYVPAVSFRDHKLWRSDLFVIPEYYFAVETAVPIRISPEHSEMMWFRYEECQERLHWDSNKTALWELNERLETGELPAPCRDIRQCATGTG